MANQICTLCGYSGEMSKKARGNGLVEFLLWCFFLVPGILYSIWSRGGNGKNVCPKCASTTMIPLDTPMGKKLLAETGQEIVETKEVGKYSKKKKIIISIVVFYFLFVFIVLLMMA